jgi:hypothetical protein
VTVPEEEAKDFNLSIKTFVILEWLVLKLSSAKGELKLLDSFQKFELTF